MPRPIALVTGGGSGIGLAVAEHLVANHGYRVAIADIVLERVQEQAERLGYDRCLALHLDVTDYESQCKAFAQTFEWGSNRLDLFFANAGIGDSDTLYKDTELDASTGLPKPVNLRTIDVNLNAIIQGINLARHFFNSKDPTPRGRIVVTSSTLGLYSHHCLPLYAASKHALVGLVRSLAPVYAHDKITINSIHPTLIATNLTRPEIMDMWPKEALTPMSTVHKAFDCILADEKMTGQTMELVLEEVVFAKQREFSRENVRFVVEESDGLWELMVREKLPRAVGENAIRRE